MFRHLLWSAAETAFLLTWPGARSNKHLCNPSLCSSPAELRQRESSTSDLFMCIKLGTVTWPDFSLPTFRSISSNRTWDIITVQYPRCLLRTGGRTTDIYPWLCAGKLAALLSAASLSPSWRTHRCLLTMFIQTDWTADGHCAVINIRQPYRVTAGIFSFPSRVMSSS